MSEHISHLVVLHLKYKLNRNCSSLNYKLNICQDILNRNKYSGICVHKKLP